MFVINSTENKFNFFAGHNEWDILRVSYFVFHILLTFVVPLLLYCIYWYERFSSDLHYRMLPNMLLSHSCLVSFARSIFVRIPSVFILLTGHFSYTTCDIFIFFARLFFLIFLHEIALWQFIRFLFLFKGNKLMNVDDDFWAFFLTVSNLFLTTILSITTSMLGYQSADMDYHFCSGIDPRKTIEQRFFLMPWYDDKVRTIFNFEKVIRTDPAGKLTKTIALLLLFFCTQNWIFSKKQQFIKFKEKLFQQTSPEQDLETNPTGTI